MDGMSRDKKLLNEPDADPASNDDHSTDSNTPGGATTNRRSTDTSRYERYSVILDTIVAENSVEIDSVKNSHPSEKPAFITRTINQLVTEGWLVREVEHGRYVWNQSRGEFDPKKWLDQKIFGVQIKAAPSQDRPRERLLEIGKENLTLAELVAILIRSGRPGESAVIAGQKVAKAFQGKMDRLASAGRGELKSISSAIEKTAYCQIMAGIELGRRIAALFETKGVIKIAGSEDAIQFCERRFARLATDTKQEEFHIVTLDTKNQVIDTHQITVGTLDASLVHPREVFRAAIKDAASSILLVHNHPSGDPTPSKEDHAVTNRLSECGKTLGIDVLDHIIIGHPRSVSIHTC